MENVNPNLEPRFKVIKEIKRGGMGAIYQAVDNTTNAEVAIKQMLVARSSAATKDLFKREHEILSKLDHPNILNVFEYFENISGDYYSMELLPCPSLKELILKWKGSQSLVLTLNLLLQFAKALRHIHEREIIHHDVHPHNLLVLDAENNAQIKLIDFGISLYKGTQKEEDIKIGASNYKSPEHYRGDRLDYTADIYCFGAISYELLTGEQPFDSKKLGFENSVMIDFVEQRLHALKAVPAITKLPKKIAYKLNRMVQICMEKDPEHRYQSMQELVERVEDLMEDLNPR